MLADDLTKKLKTIVGKDRLILSKPERQGDAAPNLLTVRPQNWQQIRELVLFARENKINLITRSSGAPHFREYAKEREAGLVVDLAAMNQVLRINRKNKVAYIEPGVTFGTLSEKAAAQGLKVMTPLLPKASKSVLASGLEREPIIAPKFHWDMTDPLLCTELVLGTGELYRTGSAGSPGTIEEQIAAKVAHKNPMGPGQTDFLRIVQGAQGTMAIATWATVKLEVKPTVHKLYFVPEKNLAKLIDFSYRALRPKLGDEFFILNAYVLATILADTPDRIHELAAQQAPFTAVYGVAGYTLCAQERVDYQERDLAAIAQAAGVTITREVPGASAALMAEIISRPSRESYYKEASKGAFLDIFFITTLNRVGEFIEIMHRSAQEHDYPMEEVGMYIQPILQGRAAHVEFTLYYHPADEKETARTKSLFKSASENLDRAGAFFSRPYGSWADLAYERCPDTVRVQKQVKNMFDPDGILNQGRLCF